MPALYLPSGILIDYSSLWQVGISCIAYLSSRLLDKRFYTPFCTLYVRLFRRSYLVLDTCLISGNIHYFCIVFKLWNCNEQLLNE